MQEAVVHRMHACQPRFAAHLQTWPTPALSPRGGRQGSWRRWCALRIYDPPPSRAMCLNFSHKLQGRTASWRRWCATRRGGPRSRSRACPHRWVGLGWVWQAVLLFEASKPRWLARQSRTGACPVRWLGLGAGSGGLTTLCWPAGLLPGCWQACERMARAHG